MENFKIEAYDGTSFTIKPTSLTLLVNSVNPGMPMFVRSMKGKYTTISQTTGSWCVPSDEAFESQVRQELSAITGILDERVFLFEGEIPFLYRIVIGCLIAQPGETVCIQCPEIYQPPQAVVNLALFFAKIIAKKVNLVIETCSEHLLSTFRWLEYKKELPKTVVYYFYLSEASHFPLMKEIFIDTCGNYVFKNKRICFPAGYFDVSLSKLMEIGL